MTRDRRLRGVSGWRRSQGHSLAGLEPGFSDPRELRQGDANVCSSMSMPFPSFRQSQMPFSDEARFSGVCPDRKRGHRPKKADGTGREVIPETIGVGTDEVLVKLLPSPPSEWRRAKTLVSPVPAQFERFHTVQFTPYVLEFRVVVGKILQPNSINHPDSLTTDKCFRHAGSILFRKRT